MPQTKNSLNEFENPSVNINTTTGDTGTKNAGTFNGATQINTSGVGMIVTAQFSAVTGTVTAQLQWSPDNGTTWLAFGPATATLAAPGTIGILVYPTNWSLTPGATPTDFTTGHDVSVKLNASMPKTWRIQLVVVTTSAVLTNIYVNYIC